MEILNLIIIGTKKTIDLMNRRYKTYSKMASFTLLTVLLMAFNSCVSDEFQTQTEKRVVNNRHTLTIVPSIYKGSSNDVKGSTRIDDSDPNVSQGDLVDAKNEMWENYFETLDVFVVKRDEANGTYSTDPSKPWDFEYHLVAGGSNTNTNPNFQWVTDTSYGNNHTSLKDKEKQLLEDNWAIADNQAIAGPDEDGYDPSAHYSVYVTANNPRTAASNANKPQNLNELRALAIYEGDIEQYFKEVNEGENLPAGYNYINKNTIKDYKKFMMDGEIEDWTFDTSSPDQTFKVDLKRAAAKIIVRMKYSDRKTILEDDETYLTNTQYIPDPDNPYVSIKEWLTVRGLNPGVPRWKYSHFAFKTADVASGDFKVDLDNLGYNDGAEHDLQTHASAYLAEKDGNVDDGGVELSNLEDSWTITTYSYSIEWGDNYQKAPFLLLSILYSNEDNSKRELRYYRIPVCDERKVTSLDRNNIYLIDVEIASLGSENSEFEYADEPLRIEYHVMPWTDLNSVTNVKVTDSKYLTVTPKTYNLRGDGVQAVDLQWFASVSLDDGRFVDIDKSSVTVTYKDYLGRTQDIKGTVIKSTTAGATSDSPATSFNGRNDVYITSTASGTGAHGEQVVIHLDVENHTIQVSSEALENRAVKEIAFTVMLRDGNKPEAELLKERVVIKHFPMDNIQNVKGMWSSRHVVGNVTVGTYDLAEAQGWVADYGVSLNTTTRREYYTYAQWNANQANITRVEEHQDREFEEATSPNNNQWRNNYYDESHTYHPTNSNWYYWRQNGNGQYYRAQYYQDRTYYTATIPVADPTSTGDWVDWERDQNVNATGRTTNDGHFRAKVYNNNDIWDIGVRNTGAYASANNNLFSNNAMYVIQITATNDQYVLGNPVITSNQSQDKVVSPAFMLASQLGGLNSTFTTAQEAADHCATYMEVGMDTPENPEIFRNKRLIGWRLPTADEIRFIINYQQTSSPTYNTTVSQVLTATSYWALNGNYVFISDGHEGTTGGGGTANGYIRCVRDLTLDEIKALNGN